MRIRQLPYAIAEGATNMAADETLLHTAVQGIASLRFYGWTTATVSLGYFQPFAVHLSDPALAQLPWVRRHSGGATLVHHHELTYALALPAGSPWQTGASWLVRMHRIIVAALADLGLAGKIVLVEDTPTKHGDVLCFHQYTVGDVLCAGRKVVGSAQRKHRQALMQHGSILLAQSEHTPSLPGVRELTGIALRSDTVRDRVIQQFADDTGWHAPPDEWAETEVAMMRSLAIDRYATVGWNERR